MAEPKGKLYELFKQPQPVADGTAAPAIPVTGDGTTYGLKALADEVATLAATPEGQRNDQANRAGFNIGQLIAGGHVARDDAERELVAAAVNAGLPPGEARRAVRSGIHGATAKPRAAMPRPDEIGPPEPVVIEETVDELTGEITEAEVPFWEARPVLAHIRRYALARMASPWAVLGVVLMRILSTIPPAVALPPMTGGRGSLNLFCALVGPPGSGKGAAEAVARECVVLPAVIRTCALGSGEGIAHQYLVWDNKEKMALPVDPSMQMLFQVAEIDAIASLTGRLGSTLMPQLRQAFSGEQLGFAYAAQEKRLLVPPHGYRLCLTTGVQPDRAGVLLDDAEGGTPQRFIWVPATDTAITADEVDAGEPWTVPRVHWPEVVRRSGGLVDVPADIRLEVREARAAQSRGETPPMDGHSMFAKLKVAVALAVLDGRPDVDVSDWALAGAVMEKSASTRQGVQDRLARIAERDQESRTKAESRRAAAVSEAVADAAVQRVCRVIGRKLRAAGSLSRSEVRRSVTARDRGSFDEALDRLTEAGQVRVDPGPRSDVLTWVEADE